MNIDETLLPGEQIAYVPRHAKGDLSHPDVDFGFIQEDRGASCLCRFWAWDRKHQLQVGDLKTKANAVSVYKTDLVRHPHCEQRVIDNYLRVRGGAELAQRKMFGMPLGLRKMR